MVRTKYIPCKHLYDNYYTQSGGSYPVFSGNLVQKGYGLAGLLSGLARTVMSLGQNMPIATKTIQRITGKLAKHAVPILKKSAKNLAKKTLKSSIKEVPNLLNKKTTPKQFLSKQKKNILKNLAETIGDEINSKKRKGITKTNKNIKRQKTDIFF